MNNNINKMEAEILRSCLDEWKRKDDFDKTSVNYLLHKDRKYLISRYQSSMSNDYEHKCWYEITTSQLGKRALQQFDDNLNKEQRKSAEDKSTRRKDKIFEIFLVILGYVLGLTTAFVVNWLSTWLNLAS